MGHGVSFLYLHYATKRCKTIATFECSLTSPDTINTTHTTKGNTMKHTTNTFTNYHAHLISPTGTQHTAAIEYGIDKNTITHTIVQQFLDTTPDPQEILHYIKTNPVLFIYTLENGTKVGIEHGYTVTDVHKNTSTNPKVATTQRIMYSDNYREQQE